MCEKGRRGRPIPSGKASSRILKKIIWDRIWTSQMSDWGYQAYQAYWGWSMRISLSSISSVWRQERTHPDLTQSASHQPKTRSPASSATRSWNIAIQFKHKIYEIYVHLEVSEVEVSKGASSEATEDPSNSTNHQLDHPNHDVGRAEIIEIILVIDMFVIVSGSL